MKLTVIEILLYGVVLGFAIRVGFFLAECVGAVIMIYFETALS